MNARASIIGPIVRDLGRAPRLTAEQERGLASARPPRPGGNDREARAAWEADPDARAAWRRWLGSDARATLILSVAPLALRLAVTRSGRDFGEDAASQGLLIAIRAVDNFDPALGWRLTTYVASCMGTALARDLFEHGFAIRVPDYLRVAALRPPAEGEHRYVADARAVLHVPAFSELGDGGEDYDPAGPGREDDGRPGPDELERLRRAVDRLEPRLARAVRAYHLPAPGEPRATLAAIGGELGLTKERARQLLAEALRRLREDLESPPGRPRIAPPPRPAPAPGSRLTADQRATLAALLAERPRDSLRRVAMTFESRTGRPVDRQTVWELRRQGGYKDRPANGHLGPAEREVLARLLREGDGRRPPSCREVADRFAAVAGRPINPMSVWRFRARTLGTRRRLREAAGHGKEA